MTYCVSCGAENADGTQFCVRCGAQLAPSSGPEAWRSTGDVPPGQPAPTVAAGPGSGPGSYTGPGSTPGGSPGSYPPPQQGGFPTYNPPQTPMNYAQPGAAQPLHPAIPAIVSFMIPGIGLLFVKDKAGLGMGICGAWIAYCIVSTILSFVFIGLCLFMILPIGHIAAAIHSWDEAAKQSNGQFQPILFK